MRLFEGQAIPSLAPYDFLFVLGGAQDTWQEDQHPWLAAEKQAIREWVVERAKPYFGVCLGHQLLATALGGEVAPADEGEVGVFDVTLTEEATSHRLMQGLEPSQKVMQWHMAEVKRVPEGRACLPHPAHAGAGAGGGRSCPQHPVPLRVHAADGGRLVQLPGYVATLERHWAQGAYPALVAAVLSVDAADGAHDAARCTTISSPPQA